MRAKGGVQAVLFVPVHAASSKVLSFDLRFLKHLKALWVVGIFSVYCIFPTKVN